MLNLHSTSNYAQERLSFLLSIERLRIGSYLDSRGIPSIGIGFNLQDAFIRGTVFDTLGINASDPRETPYINVLTAYLGGTYLASQESALQNALNQVMLERSQALGVTGTTFSFASEAEIETAFNRIIPKYENLVDRWIQEQAIGGNLLFQDNKERIVLVSLAYNSRVNSAGLPTTLGNKLAAALRNDDRAEAWYEIRYNTNPLGTGDERGIANRRYKESDKFDLYENTALTDTEAKGIYRMFTRHKETILAYEDPSRGGFDPTDINANSQKIDFNLAFAHDLLNNDFSVTQGISVTWNRILVGEDATTTYYHGTDADLLTGSGQSDLIFGESGNDVLEGRGGADVLYGGSGVDIYQYRPGDGNDIVVDADGQGLLLYDPDGQAQGLTVGLRKPDDPPGEWQSPDQTITYRQDGADLTIVTPGGTVTVKDFNKDTNDLGIRLAA